MIIEPKIRGFICTTAHPVGCAKCVENQIQYVVKQLPIFNGPKKVLIIGASTGYGLASRIAAAFGAKAQTIGVFLERVGSVATSRVASAGWYHTAAFEQKAHQAGLYAKSINGDAFSDAVKQQTIALIQEDWGGEVDLVIYSLAAPRRIHPRTGVTFNSILKPIGAPYTSKTIDVMREHVSEIYLEPATDKEVADTVAVMGGEDWMMWIEALLQANLLAKGVQAVAYAYIGPVLTYPIYKHGTIGRAKQHLIETSKVLQQRLDILGGDAFISINKALVTQASVAIPGISLYISLLYKVMKEKNIHEGCIEQIYRLYVNRLYRTDQQIPLDAQGFIRMDDWEMYEDVQQAITERWSKVNDENLHILTDVVGCRDDFYKLFGFAVDGVDYNQEVEIEVPIPSLG